MPINLMKINQNISEIEYKRRPVSYSHTGLHRVRYYIGFPSMTMRLQMLTHSTGDGSHTGRTNNGSHTGAYANI